MAGGIGSQQGVAIVAVYFDSAAPTGEGDIAVTADGRIWRRTTHACQRLTGASFGIREGNSIVRLL